MDKPKILIQYLVVIHTCKGGFMTRLFTSGQAARKLRVSISTLKRWLEDPEITIPDKRNYNGWRLFSESDITTLSIYKRDIKRTGKRFNETMLIPVNAFAERSSEKDSEK